MGADHQPDDGGKCGGVKVIVFVDAAKFKGATPRPATEMAVQLAAAMGYSADGLDALAAAVPDGATVRARVYIDWVDEVDVATDMAAPGPAE